MSGLNNWINIDWNTPQPTCSMDFSNLTVMSKQDAIDHTVNKLTENYFVFKIQSNQKNLIGPYLAGWQPCL